MFRHHLLLGALVLAAGCNQAPESQTRTYQLTGQIVGMAPERREVTIRHEDIPNFMPGMTMPFTVGEAELLDGKTPGDLVTGTLVVGDTAAHLSTLTKTGHSPLQETAGQPAFLRPGTPVADAPLVDQSGAARPLSSLRGHRVALTFIYTRCPLPEFCPLMDRHFAAVQKALAGKPGLADVRLVSVTLDPEFDTPAVLAAHAARLRADPGVWSFLTGEPAVVRGFEEQFGIYNERSTDDPAQITHNLRTAVIDPDGRVVKIITGNDWTPAGLLDDLAAAPAPGH